MLHYVCLSTDAKSEVVLTIPAHRCVDIWNLRSQYARFCGMIINNDGKHIYTVKQSKIDLPLRLSVRYTTEQAASCIYWFESLASELSVVFSRALSVFMNLHWPDQAHLGPPPRQPLPIAQESHLSSALGPELRYRCTCLQPWPLPVLTCWLDLTWLDLTWVMTCHLPFVWWWLSCWWNLSLGSSAEPGLDHLAQVCWEGILGGQVVTPAWIVITSRSCLAFLCGGTPILKLCDYDVDNFPIEIRITACLEVTDAGKKVTRTLTPG